ncbi:MAG: hypothetical protein HZY77_07690 [Thiobacillus sp.]|uniref:hypothetical protein n=1 Tax=Thiobacillus sp. TaxID=924 RepID=UPI00168C8392|nr:hypothetical protein [Thiobacillus sp.]QLQ02704.1 MAG: hypothetical protein HZY77_07690 [Thiobacillus sp.]
MTGIGQASRIHQVGVAHAQTLGLAAGNPLGYASEYDPNKRDGVAFRTRKPVSWVCPWQAKAQVMIKLAAGVTTADRLRRRAKK